MPEPTAVPTIQVDQQADIAVLTPSAEVAAAPEKELERAGTAALTPLRSGSLKGVIVDLSKVDHFGSLFLAFLIRCHALAKKQGGRLVLVGASNRARELLRLTALDTLWEIYADYTAAIEALRIPA
jgi:anti-anti-sigma factor